MPSPEIPLEYPEEEAVSRSPEANDGDFTGAIDVAFTAPEHESSGYEDEAPDIASASEVQVAPPVPTEPHTLLRPALNTTVRVPTPELPSATTLVRQQIDERGTKKHRLSEKVPTSAERRTQQPKDREEPVLPEIAITPPEASAPAKIAKADQEASQSSARVEQTVLAPVSTEVEHNTDSGTPDEEPTPEPERSADSPPEEEKRPDKPKPVAPSERSQDVLDRVDTSITAEEIVGKPSPLEEEIHSSADYKLAFVKDSFAGFAEVTEKCEVVAIEIPGMHSERFRLEMSEVCSNPEDRHSIALWSSELSRNTEDMIKRLRVAGKGLLVVGLTQGDANYEYVAQAKHFINEFDRAEHAAAKGPQLRALLENHIYASVMARQKEADCIAKQLGAYHEQWPGELIGVVLDEQHARGSLCTDSVVNVSSDPTYLNQAKDTEDALAPIDAEVLDRTLLERTYCVLLPSLAVGSIAAETVREMSHDYVKQVLDAIEVIKRRGYPSDVTNREICSFLKMYIRDR